MSYEYKGVIAEIGTPKQISDKFSIQTLVLSQEATKKDGEPFTKNALFEFSNLNLLKGLKVGQTVKVGFDLDARKYKDVWYGKAKGWKLAVEGGGQSSEAMYGAETKNDSMDTTANSEDDLPF